MHTPNKSSAAAIKTIGECERPDRVAFPIRLAVRPNRFLLPDSKTGETVFSPSVKNGVTSSVYRANASTPADCPLTITSAAGAYLPK